MINLQERYIIIVNLISHNIEQFWIKVLNEVNPLFKNFKAAHCDQCRTQS